MNFITIDDLTYEDLSIIRSIHMKLVFSKKRVLSENDFIQSAIDKYNKGDYSLISLKPPKVEDSFDLFTDTIVPLIASESPLIMQTKQSNVGKRIYIENSMGHNTHFTLVDNSDDVDPENKKISIHCDLGKLLVNARVNDILQFKDLLMVVTDIT